MRARIPQEPPIARPADDKFRYLLVVEALGKPEVVDSLRWTRAACLAVQSVRLNFPIRTVTVERFASVNLRSSALHEKLRSWSHDVLCGLHKIGLEEDVAVDVAKRPVARTVVYLIVEAGQEFRSAPIFGNI